jgi:hypothetical protein
MITPTRNYDGSSRPVLLSRVVHDRLLIVKNPPLKLISPIHSFSDRTCYGSLSTEHRLAQQSHLLTNAINLANQALHSHLWNVVQSDMLERPILTYNQLSQSEPVPSLLVST